MAAAGPPLLHEAGDDERDPDHYMATWLCFIRKLSERGLEHTELNPARLPC